MPRETTLLEWMIKKHGFRRARLVGTFITTWALAEDAAGHEIDVEHYARYWHVSRSQAYRRQQQFREVFPDETTPTRLVELAQQSDVSQVPVKQFGLA